MNLPVYLDNNATTPMDPEVLETMLPYFMQKFGNAASKNHSFGWIAEEAVDHARKQIAALINAQETELVFTSGATEAVNLAIKGVYEMYKGKGNHIITCVTEHKAVLDTCKHLEQSGGNITYLPVDEDGLIIPEELEKAITPQTILIAIMYANNETGVIQPIKEIAKIAKKNDLLFFCDATQAVGKVPVDVLSDGIHLMACSAHKLYGPKGVGILYVRRKNPRVKITAQIDGGGHERGMRSGTLNVPGIVGLGKAAELCSQKSDSETLRITFLRDKLERALLQIEATFVNGSRTSRLPGVLNISFQHVNGQALMMALKNIAVSSGSACTSASLEPSYVLKSLGLSDDLAHSAIRLGIGRFNTEEEIDYTIEQMTKAVNHLRAISPLWQMYKDENELNKV
ncbi:Cysteine desulfurase [Arcticibacter svalbardensis MN12-7]|uniref:Cysteine desulfurase IscS n=1 Tax=Arcticibacter svalbardensis MN12-7 TaxID=1150600 RepID=R9GPX8_9SPHI|nr:IscS subfamily cysteine desulfurase [Arcticibacter svalbardensis]EOR93897.1 Cysteine desulfurase [Arcticibacter svalbardensis MN12-7]